MTDEGRRVAETGEGGENDDKMDVRSNIEGRTDARVRNLESAWTLKMLQRE